jgi:hypothetical protein
MIRGAIEVAEPTRVAGWIYAGSQPLRNETVLAFVGDRCVGAGKVECFRQDLLDAKLGDGFCGFDFPVWLNEGESSRAIIVRLQNSDAALLQFGCRIGHAEDTPRIHSAAPSELGAIDPNRISWMLDRGMLEQPEYDFLKAIHSAGAYERGLRLSRRLPDDRGRAEPEQVAHDLLGLFMLSDIRVVRTNVGAVSDLATHADLVLQSAAPVLGLWSKDRCRISVEERSHLAPRRDRLALRSAPPPGAIDYSFGPDKLLLVHRNCIFAPRGPAPATGIMLLVAAPADRQEMPANSGLAKLSQIRAA